MKHPLLIWGAGGHAKVVAELARVCGHRIVAFVDRDPVTLRDIAEKEDGMTFLSELQFETLVASRVALPGNARHVLLGIGDNADRMRCVGILEEGLLMQALVHPNATLSSSASAGPGTVVFAGAVINAAAQLGRAVIVNSGAIIEHDCYLSDAVHVSPNATLTGRVLAGEGVWIGAGAVVLPGVRLGRGAIVGAGSVVLRDVPDNVTVVGNPARPIARSASGSGAK